MEPARLHLVTGAAVATEARRGRRSEKGVLFARLNRGLTLIVTGCGDEVPGSGNADVPSGA
jgi:hypothetical protein